MSLIALAQPKDSFSIHLNKKVLLKPASPVNSSAPQVVINKKDIKKKGLFAIQYKQAQKQEDWERIFQFTDAENNIQLQKGYAYTEGTFGFNNAELYTLLAKNKKLMVYTFQQPTNSLMVGIRIERYLLCELVLQ
jgi:CRISPR/Cas system-associated exonuclease Cas4 (RecB family)